MEVRDATAHMTLGDIKKRDIDNLELVVKSAKRYTFETQQQAEYFMGECVNKALKRMGVDQPALIAKYQSQGRQVVINQIDKVMAANDVKAENREYGRRALQVLKRAKEYELIGDEVSAKALQDLAKATGEKIEDLWRSGLYLYHHNEIAYFVSRPMAVAGGKYRDAHIIIPGERTYIVTTNFREGVH